MDAERQEPGVPLSEPADEPMRRRISQLAHKFRQGDTRLLR